MVFSQTCRETRQVKNTRVVEEAVGGSWMAEGVVGVPIMPLSKGAIGQVLVENVAAKEKERRYMPLGKTCSV